MKLIRRCEKIILALILGLIAPLVGLFVFWWGSLSLLPEERLPLASAAGICLGLIVDAFLLKRWVRAAHRLDDRLWAAIYLFYSVCVFGFSMGVPVLNALLALPAGFVRGGRLVETGVGADLVRRDARRTAGFTTLILGLACAASAALALLDPYTAANLKGMFSLNFAVTPGMILALIAAGGLALLAFGWGLTVASVRFSHTFLQRQ
jgi:putative flippase GtrA